MNIKFSIIVPIYKVEEFLPKCIESILNQSYSNFELLLVDDGSPDSCPQICDEYEKKDSRIRTIHKKNGGLVSARNVGIANSRGNYICYVDGDDWIDKNLLKKVNKAINETDPDIVVFNLEKIYKDRKEPVKFDNRCGLYNKKELSEEIYPIMMYDPSKPFCKGKVFPAACNKVYKKKLLEEHYCRDERIKMGEDNAFVFECFLYAERVYYLDEILYEYNQLNVNSFSNSYDAKRFENNMYLTKYIEKRILPNHEYMYNQINAFKAYWLIMAIFHEVKNKRKFFDSVNHLKNEIKRFKVIDDIKYEGLPLMAQGYLLLLKSHLYSITLLASKFVCYLRK